MSLFYILLLPLCLLLAQVVPGAGILRTLNPWSPRCIRIGGNCFLYRGPEGTEEDGGCFQENSKCCV